jgi:hypothetical protein
MGYADLGLSPGTVGVHHAVLHRALKQADRGRLITLANETFAVEAHGSQVTHN